MKKIIYFDNNSTTRVDPEVAKVVVESLTNIYGNPSSIHSVGRDAAALLESSRQTIAKALSVKNKEIFFTSGGTEGARVLLHGLTHNLTKKHIISSAAEHPCVLENLKLLESKGFSITYLQPNHDGVITADDVEKAILPSTGLITLMAANNETGAKIDIAKIADSALQKDILFVLDAVALFGKEEFSLRPGISAAFFSGHKIYAPKGVGFCYLNCRCRINPTLVGGGQEFGLRAGTQNLSSIAGLAKAVEILAKNSCQISAQLANLKNVFEARVKSLFPLAVINAEAAERVVNTSNISFMTVDSESLQVQLDLAGVAVSIGSACSSGARQPSKVLQSMKLSTPRVDSAIRFSFGKYNSLAEVEEVLKILKKIINKN